MLGPKLSLSLLLTCAISLTSLQYAEAAATASDIIYAIQAAQILDPSATVNAAVKGDKIFISAHRDPRENANDRKINAVLMARAALETAGDGVSRVTVQYYEANDNSTYQEVSVSAGDIKAFASGSISQEQLLNALTLEPRHIDSAADKVARVLESGAYARPEYKVAIANNDQVLVSTALAEWVPDDELLVEALRIANNTAQAAPANVREIKVAFTDPRGKAQTREVAFGAADVPKMWERIHGDMAAIKIARTQPAVELDTIEVADGPLKEAREAILGRLKALQKSGVGIGNFLKFFIALEQQVPTSDEAKIRSTIESLNRSLDSQQEAAKAAKNFQAGKPTGPSGPVPDHVVDPPGQRTGYGQHELLAINIVRDPDAQMAPILSDKLVTPAIVVRAYDRVISVLVANGMKGQAARFQQQAAQFRARIRTK